MPVGHFWAIWQLVDPGWPLHVLWPQQCITLWSGFLPIKFGGHRAFLSNLTPGWPLHDLWPTQCITPWSEAFPTKFRGHRAFLKQFDFWMIFDDWRGRFENTLSNLPPCQVSAITPFPQSRKEKCVGVKTKRAGTYSFGLITYSGLVLIFLTTGSGSASRLSNKELNLNVNSFGASILVKCGRRLLGPLWYSIFQISVFLSGRIWIYIGLFQMFSTFPWMRNYWGGSPQNSL